MTALTADEWSGAVDALITAATVAGQAVDRGGDDGSRFNRMDATRIVRQILTLVAQLAAIEGPR